jgi:hypothetical protein
VTAQRIVRGLVVLSFLGILGILASLIVNALVLDDFDKYGDVPVPGSRALRLPAGEADVSFHVQMPTTLGNAGSLTLPDLHFGMSYPDRFERPVVTDDSGSTTNVNGDAHRRVWTVDVRSPGRYRIKTRGNVGGFIDPRLAFGENSSHSLPVIPFVILLGVSIVGLVAMRLRSR